MSISKRNRDLIVTVLAFPSLILVYAAVATFMASLGSVLIRVAYYLKNGVDFATSCGIAVMRVVNSDTDLSPYLCFQTSTNWLGFDKIAHWIFHTADVSLIIFLIAVLSFVLALLWAFIVRGLTELLD